MKKLFIFFLLICINTLFALSADEILKKVDKNMYYRSIKYTGIMKIKKDNRKPRTKTYVVIAEGKDKAFIEFTNPGDRGTKYLKLGDELWVKGVYAERADKISGHLLRESMMGSDFSYEDATKNEKLIDKYKAKLSEVEKINNKECYKLILTAKVKKISYPKQILWVDKETFIPIKVQYFALSGILLKEMKILKTEKIGNRIVPVKLRMENQQRKNSWTLMELKNVQIDVAIKNSIFSKRNLER